MEKSFKGNLGAYDRLIVLNTGLDHDNIEGWVNDLRMSDKKKREVVQEIYKIGKDILDGTISERVIDGFYYPDSKNMSESKYAGYASSYWRDVLQEVGVIQKLDLSKHSINDDIIDEVFGGVTPTDYSVWYSLDSDLTNTTERLKKLLEVLERRRLKVVEKGPDFYDNYDLYIAKLDKAIEAMKDPSQTNDLQTLTALGIPDVKKWLATTEEDKFGYNSSSNENNSNNENDSKDNEKKDKCEVLGEYYAKKGYSEKEVNKIIEECKAELEALSAGWTKEDLGKVESKPDNSLDETNYIYTINIPKAEEFDSEDLKTLTTNVEKWFHSEDPINEFYRLWEKIRPNIVKYINNKDFIYLIGYLLNKYYKSSNPLYLLVGKPKLMKIFNMSPIGHRLYKLNALSVGDLEFIYDEYANNFRVQKKAKFGGKLINYKQLFKSGGNIYKASDGMEVPPSTTSSVFDDYRNSEKNEYTDSIENLNILVEEQKAKTSPLVPVSSPGLTPEELENLEMWDNYNKYPWLMAVDSSADILDIISIFGKHWVVPVIASSALRGVSSGVVSKDPITGIKNAAIGPLSVLLAKGVGKAINLGRSTYGLTGKTIKFLTENGRLAAGKNKMAEAVIEKASTRLSPVDMKMLEFLLAKTQTPLAVIESVLFTKNGVYVRTLEQKVGDKVIPSKEIKVGSRDWYHNFGEEYAKGVGDARLALELDMHKLLEGKTGKEAELVKKSEQYKSLSKALEEYNGLNEEVALIRLRIPKINFNNWFRGNRKSKMGIVENLKLYKDALAMLGTYEASKYLLDTTIGDRNPKLNFLDVANVLLGPLFGKATKGIGKFKNYSVGSKVTVKLDDATPEIKAIYKGVYEHKGKTYHIIQTPEGKTLRVKSEQIIPNGSGYKEYIPQTNNLHYQKTPKKATSENLGIATSVGTLAAAESDASNSYWKGLKFNINQSPMVLIDSTDSNKFVSSARPYITGTYYGDDKNTYSFETDSNTGDYQIYNSKGQLLFRGKPESKTKIPGKNATIWDLHSQMLSMYQKGGE